MAYAFQEKRIVISRHSLNESLDHLQGFLEKLQHPAIRVPPLLMEPFL